FGLLLWPLAYLERINPAVDGSNRTSYSWLRALILYLLGLFFILGGKEINYSAAGALGTMICALVAATVWKISPDDFMSGLSRFTSCCNNSKANKKNDDSLPEDSSPDNDIEMADNGIEPQTPEQEDTKSEWDIIKPVSAILATIWL